MLGRGYLVFGSLVLLGYAMTAYQGWEFGNPNRYRVPAAGVSRARAGGGWWWWHWSGSSSRSGGGWGRGGK